MGDVSRFPSFLRRAAPKEPPTDADPDMAVDLSMIDAEVAAIGQMVAVLKPLREDVRNRTLKYLNDRFYYAPPEPETQQLETDDDGLVQPTRQGEYKLED